MEDMGDALKYFVMLIVVVFALTQWHQCSPIQASINNCENANQYLLEEHTRCMETVREYEDYLDGL